MVQQPRAVHLYDCHDARNSGNPFIVDACCLKLFSRRLTSAIEFNGASGVSSESQARTLENSLPPSLSISGFRAISPVKCHLVECYLVISPDYHESNDTACGLPHQSSASFPIINGLLVIRWSRAVPFVRALHPLPSSKCLLDNPKTSHGPRYNCQCCRPPSWGLHRQPLDLSPGTRRWSAMLSEASIMGTTVCPGCFYRFLPLPFHHWRLDPRHWNDHQCGGVLARYISLHRVLWDLKTVHISLFE